MVACGDSAGTNGGGSFPSLVVRGADTIHSVVLRVCRFLSTVFYSTKLFNHVIGIFYNFVMSMHALRELSLHNCYNPRHLRADTLKTFQKMLF